MSILFSPLTLKSVELKNRIVVSPMCMYAAEDGFANDWHLVHLGSRAVGGAGLIIAEATAVSPEGRITPDDLGLWKEEHIDYLKRINTFVEQHGSVLGVQLAHAGRKASTSSEWKGGGGFLRPEQGGWKILAPSALAFSQETGVPCELSKEEIKEVVADFASAARRAAIVGFKVAEIHAAHGYLIHQFLSPLSNRRQDEYGGSFENRVRFLLEVVAAVREEWNAAYPLFVRISATDWIEEGGWDLAQSIQLCSILKEKGVDLIDVSSGGVVPHARIPVDYGYQLSLANQIRQEAGIAVGTVGMLTNAVQTETILRNANADLIMMGRQLLRDPYFPLHAAKELDDDISWPVQYQRAKI